LEINGSEDDEWRVSPQNGATAYDLAQFSCSVAMMSGEESAKPVKLEED